MEDRRSSILRALVEEYIRTGEPVSSRAILAATGMAVSAATIRNDLAALEREGLVIQPHTSAGRVPTARAYRFYVDHLTAPRLGAASRHRIADFFSSVHTELGKLLKSTSELLADITHYPAVVVGPGLMEETVRAVHLVQTGAQTTLLVVVTDAGRVSQELCRLDTPATPAQIAEAERVLTQLMVGKDPGSAEVLRERLSTLPEPVRAIADTASEVLRRASHRSADVYLGGTRQMATLWEDLSTVHRVLEVLEREAMLLNVLARVPGTSIQIGAELPVEMDMAVVSATYDVGGSPAGQVGVIGPMRMDYRTAISAVEGVSQGLGDRIGT